MKNYFTKIFILLMFFSVISYAGCSSDSTGKDITVQQLKEMQKENPDLVILDVRTPQELVGPLGKIDGVVNIPVQVLEQNIDKIKEFEDKDIAIICRSGNRSKVAQKILEKHGIESVNVLGGMKDWNK